MEAARRDVRDHRGDFGQHYCRGRVPGQQWGTGHPAAKAAVGPEWAPSVEEITGRWGQCRRPPLSRSEREWHQRPCRHTYTWPRKNATAESRGRWERNHVWGRRPLPRSFSDRSRSRRPVRDRGPRADYSNGCDTEAGPTERRGSNDSRSPSRYAQHRGRRTHDDSVKSPNCSPMEEYSMQSTVGIESPSACEDSSHLGAEKAMRGEQHEDGELQEGARK